MKILQTRIDAIREEFQDARPDVALLIYELQSNTLEQQARIRELEKEKTMPKPLDCTYPTGEIWKIDSVDYTPTEAEIEAAAAAMADNCGKIFKWEYMDNEEKALFLEKAKVALEAAAKVRGK